MTDSSREDDRPVDSSRRIDEPPRADTSDADHRELVRKTADLARKTAELQILQRVSSEISSTLDLEEIYDIALRTMDELFQFHHANILLVEPGGQTLLVVASRGYENQAIGGRAQIGTGVIGLVAKNRKMLHLSNLGQQRAYAAAQRRQMIKSGRGAEIGNAVPVPGLPNAESQFAIPLLVKDELIGVFSIESPVRHSFSEHDRGLVSIVANQIAIAIHNARLYEDRRRAAEALREVNASLEERVAERTAALERELRVAEELLTHARSRVDGPLLGGSRVADALRDAVAREAPRSEPLLLLGPAGAGKEAVARAVHGTSRRRGAFIYVSCPELHTQDGLTPPEALATRGEGTELSSKLDLAVGGTLFLDAVHELPSGLQRSLRELLEHHDHLRRRGESPTPDVRVIASTTWDPSRERESLGRSHALFDLLARNTIAVPALADRPEDIPALVDHFVRQSARQVGKVVDGVSPESMQRLQAYKWPGNIRELRTVLERAVLVARNPILEIDEELLDEGRAVGSYRLVSLLGSGGMGEVWLAKHRLLARPAAVKLIRHDLPPGLRTRAARPALPPRGTGHGGPAVAAHRSALRLRRQRQRLLLLRHGAARRPRPAPHRQTLRTSTLRARDHAHAAGVPVTRRSTRARPRASRHQAGQPVRHRAPTRVRLPEGPGFRDRQGSTRPGGDDAHGPGSAARHACVHGP